MTIYNATSDDTVVKLITFCFQWYCAEVVESGIIVHDIDSKLETEILVQYKDISVRFVMRIPILIDFRLFLLLSQSKSPDLYTIKREIDQLQTYSPYIKKK